MPTVKAEDLGPGVTSITWKGQIYTADADGNITIDDEEFDPAHVEEQGERAQAEAERKDRTATEAEPGMEPKEAGARLTEAREKREGAPAAGQSEAEAEGKADGEADREAGGEAERDDSPSAPRRGRPPNRTG